MLRIINYIEKKDLGFLHSSFLIFFYFLVRFLLSFWLDSNLEIYLSKFTSELVEIPQWISFFVSVLLGDFLLPSLFISELLKGVI